MINSYFFKILKIKKKWLGFLILTLPFIILLLHLKAWNQYSLVVYHIV